MDEQTADLLLERLTTTRRRDMADGGPPSLDISDVHAGVTVAWFAQVFGMDPTTVKKRLADCPPLHRRKAGYVYSVKQAAPYLIKPVFDIKKYLSGMKPNELPPQLTKEYWDAALKRQLWEERAGDLWRTERVLEIFSDVFLMMKSTMLLWVEDLERITGVTQDQRAEIVKLVDELQNELHRKLTGLKTSTPNMIGEIEIDNLEEDLVG